MKYQGGRNSLSLIAGIIMLISLLLPWYEMHGRLEEGEAYWKVYPLWQDYSQITRIFPEGWKASGPPMPRIAFFLLPSMVIALSSAFVKTWSRRALCLTISVALILVGVGDFVQGWLRIIIRNGFPPPPGELVFEGNIVTTAWGPGVFIAGIGLILIGMAACLDVFRMIVAMGKEAAESLGKRPTTSQAAESDAG
ncbi:MAG: hypothetical protein QW797_04160 [Thermoproteota archaeon]